MFSDRKSIIICGGEIQLSNKESDYQIRLGISESDSEWGKN